MYSWRLAMTAFIVAMALMTMLLGYAGDRKTCPAEGPAGIAGNSGQEGIDQGRQKVPCPLQLEIITLGQGAGSGMEGMSSLPMKTKGS